MGHATSQTMTMLLTGLHKHLKGTPRTCCEGVLAHVQDVTCMSLGLVRGQLGEQQ